MARRRALRGVAYGLASYFVGRNNDVDGYWALGKLRRHAALHAVDRLTIDLIERSVAPNGSEFAPMVEACRAKLFGIALRVGLSHERIAEAKLVCDFTPAAGGERHRSTMGDPFAVSIWIADDLGGMRSASITGHCRIHDPAREQQRRIE